MAAIVSRDPGFIMRMFDTSDMHATQLNIKLYGSSSTETQVKVERDQAQLLLQEDAGDAAYRFKNGW